METRKSPANVAQRTVYVAASLLLLTMAFIVVKTARDAYYVQDQGIFRLPIAYVSIAVFAGPAAMLTLLVMRGLGPRCTRLVAPLFVAGLLFLYFPFAGPGPTALNTVFFIGVPLVWGILFSLSWLLAADLLEGATSEELATSYGMIGGASILGGIVGALVAKVVAETVNPRGLIVLGGFTLLGAVLTMGLAQRRFPPSAPLENAGDVRTNKNSGLRSFVDVLRSPYAVLLFFVALFAGAAGVLVEFQFYLAAASLGGGAQQSAGFFAQFYLILNGAAFLVQVLVMPRLQRAIGVYGGMAILPVAIAAGAGALVVTGASTTLRAWLRVAEGGLKSSLYRSNWEQAYLPLGERIRTISKLLIDGMGARVGEALAAVALLLWLKLVVGDNGSLSFDAYWLLYLLLIVAGGWLLITLRLGRTADRDAKYASDRLRPEVLVPDG